MKKINVENTVKERIDKYLSEVLDISRSEINRMINDKCLLLNGLYPKASSKVSDGDIISIVKEYKADTNIASEDIPLDIVYEDDDVILINKKSGMVVHPGSGNKNGTMVNALLHYTSALSDINGEIRPGIVHRIDKDTSGLILVAKNNKAHEILADDFKNKRVKRKYIALVSGVLKHNNITIDAPIGRDTVNRKKMMVTDKNSKNAITHVKVLKRYNDYTLVECTLETGRTHQIRVHMAYIVYPIFNDPVYGKGKSTAFGQFLHSSEIEFISPITKKELTFKVPIPHEFQAFLDNLDSENNK